LSIVASAQWEFQVEDSFTITGRGTGVVGTLVGVFEQSGEAAEVDVGGVIKRIDRVFLEFARYPDGERQALMLYGVAREEVPPGAVIRGPLP
jgi:hypothetical protein